MASLHRIKVVWALDQNVINKIAAGEIIVAPVNALKELIENAVDARATSIEITHEDLPILCERFTTSKLKAFEDLRFIDTYGFRGEALASISMVARLTVTTKTKDSGCAWRATYADGKLVPPKSGISADPKPHAGRPGTQITVEDLFFNNPIRKRGFRSASEEYTKILDVIGRYAVHCDGVAFSCKKHEDNIVGLSTAANTNLKGRIHSVYGSSVANQVDDFEVFNSSLRFKAKGILSNTNFRDKKSTLLLFINGRSVESMSIKKAIDRLYSAFLPRGAHPFVYLSLEIEPHHVDVNTHPTKREVKILHEDEVIKNVVAVLQEKLMALDVSRSYALTQTLLPGASPRDDKNRTSKIQGGRNNTRLPNKDSNSATSYRSNHVRVDHRDQKITSILQSVIRDSENKVNAGEYEYDNSQLWVEVRYGTIKDLRQRVYDSTHNGLANLFLNHIYVGLVDEQRRLAAVQHDAKLFLIDYAAVCYEMFYQIALSDFRNFGHIRLIPPLSVHGLLRIAAAEERELGKGETVQRTKSTENDISVYNEGDVCDSGDMLNRHGDRRFDWEGATHSIRCLLLDKRVMLRDYFSIDINDDGELISIPLLLKGYMPCLGKLPSFLLRLGPNVDWNSELECFKTLLRELALFYVPESLQQPEDENSQAVVDRLQQRKVTLENTLFPAFRKRLVPTNVLLASITEITNLNGIYMTFERSC
ncbi:hypothetical protein BDD12DRAFT_919487 [Trichophaea hybrida]|nr:hypothetical protein BDD12DRAFT_919487 [Trichophaea hybrida]